MTVMSQNWNQNKKLINLMNWNVHLMLIIGAGAKILIQDKKFFRNRRKNIFQIAVSKIFAKNTLKKEFIKMLGNINSKLNDSTTSIMKIFENTL